MKTPVAILLVAGVVIYMAEAQKPDEPTPATPATPTLTVATAPTPTPNPNFAELPGVHATPNGIPFDVTPSLPYGWKISEKSKYLGLVDKLVADARDAGYRCNSVSMAYEMVWERGYTLKCNHFDYTYNFRDKGRGWYISTE